jgi:serine/threonine-protein kinase Chk2
LTNQGSTVTDVRDDATATPKLHRRTPSDPEPLPPYSSPPGDTQCLSQFVYPPRAFVDEVEDEAAEGVWGYLIPLNDKVRDSLVLRKRDGCTDRGSKEGPAKGSQRQGKDTKNKQDQASPGGYLIGRHPECGK